MTNIHQVEWWRAVESSGENWREGKSPAACVCFFSVCLYTVVTALFKAIGIKPTKGVFLNCLSSTGKTLLARACTNQTNTVFLKLAGPQLVQIFIGDRDKLVYDTFKLAK